jgi:hypothetical protein
LFKLLTSPILYSGNKGIGYGLTTLVGVEDLWLAAPFQRHLQSLQTDLRVKAVGQLPAEHIPEKEIHDRHQVEKAFLQRDAGDSSGSHLIHGRYHV